MIWIIDINQLKRKKLKQTTIIYRFIRMFQLEIVTPIPTLS